MLKMNRIRKNHHKTMKKSKFVLMIFFPLFLISCHQNEIFFEYKSLPKSGWNKDSLLTFNFNVSDTVPAYDVFIQVRHYGDYPYQNLWLFLENKNVSKNIIKRDTIEFFLADEFGKWLGSGVGPIKEMPVYYRQQIHFPDSGMYQIKIGQGMRDSVLVGVEKVGIRIEKVVGR